MITIFNCNWEQYDFFAQNSLEKYNRLRNSASPHSSPWLMLPSRPATATATPVAASGLPFLLLLSLPFPAGFLQVSHHGYHHIQVANPPRRYHLRERGVNKEEESVRVDCCGLEDGKVEGYGD